MKTNRRIFTLVECVVMVMIAAILAAIFFPVFAREREDARQASCQSNLKQIMLAELMYAQDFSETFPVLGNKSYVLGIMPYMNKWNVLHCPSSSGTDRPRLEEDNSKSSGCISYGVRASNSGLELTRITKQDHWPVLLDLNGPNERWSAGCSTPGVTDIAAPADSRASFGTRCLAGLHNDGVDVAFADGHVKWVPVAIDTLSLNDPVRIPAAFERGGALDGQIVPAIPKTKPAEAPAKPKKLPVEAVIEDRASLHVPDGTLWRGQPFDIVDDAGNVIASGRAKK